MATLTRNDFIGILKKFADSPADVLADRSDIECVINGDEISIKLFEKDDVLMCDEGGRVQKARIWLERRVARLNVLAQKIIEATRFDEHFVDVGAQYEGIEENGVHIESVTNAILERTASSSNYATEVMYLLSEAGDGKSAIMNRVAVLAAKRYQETGCGPIVLPVSLDGRPFLRIDDLVIGILANHFRFRSFYFEGLIELVKMGSIVLGLDGFEEMVVEGKEERVISSLGELLKSFESTGRILVSARRAFYEYALKKQLPLLDSIQSMRVDCNSYRLSQWTRSEFERLLGTYALSESEAHDIYDKLIAKLHEDHPILVRPVLARKLADALGTKNGLTDIERDTSGFSSNKNPQAVMREFVRFLVQREATQKWLSTSGPSKGVQLLSVEEHMAVLRAIAEDMWLSNVEYVKHEYLQDWIGIVCGELNKSPMETNDAREKIQHHAVLTRDGDRYGFCHEAFRKYFLGQDIAKYIIDKDSSFNFERILSQDVFDASVASVIAYELSIVHMSYEDVVAFLLSVKGGASRLSPIGQNVGTILMAYAEYESPESEVEISDLFFTTTSSEGLHLRNVKFNKCSFEVFDFSDKSNLDNVSLVNCTLMSMVVTIHSPARAGLRMDEQSMPPSIVLKTGDNPEEQDSVYDPARIRDILRSCNLIKDKWDGGEIATLRVSDERMLTLLSLSMVLRRTSGLSDRALEVRFGKRWHKVCDEFLPLYLNDGILSRRDWYGGGGKERFSLNIPMSKFELARAKSNGSYEDFLVALSGIK